MLGDQFGNSANSAYLRTIFSGTESRALEAGPSVLKLNSGSFLNNDVAAEAPGLEQSSNPVLGGLDM